MKRATNILAAWAVVFAVVLTAQRCSASATKTQYRTVGITVNAVDLAMKSWGEYVRSGKATDEQEAAVKKGYETYQLVAKAAKVGLEVSGNMDTPAELQAAADAVIQIINLWTGHAAPTPAPAGKRL